MLSLDKVSSPVNKVNHPGSFFGATTHAVPFFQPKLTINQPNDIYEQEADAMADKVMRMTEPALQKKCAACEQEDEKKVQLKPAKLIQKEDDDSSPEETSPNPSPDLKLSTSFLSQPSTEPDFLALRQPFFQRSVPQLFDASSALQVWNYNFNFFRRFGVAPDLAATAANFTAPFAIDSQLKAGNPTWWEITDREMGTSSFNASLPVLNFNADFSPVAPPWFRTLFGGGHNAAVQRKCEACEQEGNSVQLKGASSQTGTGEGFENYVNSLNGSGEQLPADVRSFYEPRFGYDFSSVKIHNNATAAVSAKSINALAYTTGSNIVFGAGQYAPGSDGGKKLLAHELTHVIQQGATSGNAVQRKCNAGIRSSTWVTARSEHDFAPLDGYSELKGTIYDVYLEGNDHFFCYRDKKVYIKYLQSGQVIPDFKKMYGIELENGGARWLRSEVLLVSEALATLTDTEVARLRGYKFIKEGGVMIDDDGKTVVAGLTTQDIVENKYTIQFWKFCFDGTSDIPIKNKAGVSKGVPCILHEIGHAMMADRRRPLMEAMYDKRHYKDAYENADPAKQQKMKPKLDALAERLEKEQAADDKRPTVDAEFSKLIAGRKPLTPYSTRNTNEAFAEAFTIYKINPQLLENLNPKLFEYFRKELYR